MKRFLLAPLLSGLLTMGILCTGPAPGPDALATIGPTSITQLDVDAFNAVREFSKDIYDSTTILAQNPVSTLIAVEVLYQGSGRLKKSREIRSGREWKWRRAGLIAHLYGREAFQKYLGQSEADVRNYYATHKKEFEKLEVHDSAGVVCTTRTVAPFDSIQGWVAEMLFFSRYKPDSSTMDLRHRRTFRMFRESGYRDHFMRKMYREKYGTPLPDSLVTLVKKGGIIDSQDLRTVRSWYRGDEYAWLDSTPSSLITMALRFLLFTKQAEARGFLDRKDMTAVLSWAWKYEVARQYALRSLLPAARRSAGIDTAMALFSYWDETGDPGMLLDSGAFRRHCAHLDSLEVAVSFDSLVYAHRTRYPVRFLQDLWVDHKAKTPSELSRVADSLRDAGNAAFAQENYTLLIDHFLFLPHGKNALIEAAKIHTERRDYRAAIALYRRFLVSGADRSRIPGLMFTIGFIYDKYCAMPELAEVQYRYILKNAPQSDVAADAEVMLLHLGEPMPSIEVLRAEAACQGKKN
ncbi:MAG: hypothetical protein JW768_07070 [Chitinispirillaceae bacterium]|nr:hypothetical protein [Chitinispirillaceae bacterium]